MAIRFMLNKLYLSLFLFLLVFAPPIIKNINFMYFVAVYSIVTIVLFYKNALKEFYLRDKALKNYNMGLTLILCYWIVVAVRNYEGNLIDNYLGIGYRLLSVIFIIEPSIVYIILWCKKKGYSFYDVIDGLAKAAIIEFAFCFASVISPKIKGFLTKLIIVNTGYYGTYEELEGWKTANSYFGFSASISDYFGLGLGLISGLCFYCGITYNKKYFYYLPFILFTTLMNSVTGIVVFLISVIIVISGTKKVKISTLTFIIAFLTVLMLVMPFIQLYYPRILQKVADNFWEIFDVSRVKASNTTIRILFSERFWTLPSHIGHVLLGTGHSLIRAAGFNGSDVGYINDIWSFGILGSIYLYFINVRFFASLLKGNRKIKHFFIFTFFIFNIKGLSVGLNLGMIIYLITPLAYTFLGKSVLYHSGT